MSRGQKSAGGSKGERSKAYVRVWRLRTGSCTPAGFSWSEGETHILDTAGTRGWGVSVVVSVVLDLFWRAPVVFKAVPPSFLCCGQCTEVLLDGGW